jgi:hypothetical protein
MRYYQFKYIIDNRKRLSFDRADGGGSDLSTDPGAATAVNPNDYLPPVIGGSKILQALAIIALVLGIIYLFKLNFAQ